MNENQIISIQNKMFHKIEAFDKTINKLRYRIFIKTRYWSYVRGLKLVEQPRCSDCGGNDILQVHHKTYVNHYNEHNHLDDLVVICKECHRKRHGRKQKNPLSKSEAQTS